MPLSILWGRKLLPIRGYQFVEGRLPYWHTCSDLEVDAIIGGALVAIEFKSCTEVQKRYLSELKAFKEEHPDYRTIVVSMDERPRML